MPTDRQGLTITSADQLAPRPQSTKEAQLLQAREREDARLALHRIVVNECPKDEHEEALDEVIDMLGLRTSPLDLRGGFDRRSPRRPHLKPQRPSGGTTDVNGMQKPVKPKTTKTTS